MLVYVTHPYHRGGVTSWIRDAFAECQDNQIESALVTVEPSSPFISGKGRPAMVDFVLQTEGVVAKAADFRFELGSFAARVGAYQSIIKKNIPEGAVLIPSDDDACWAACCTVANRYSVIGVLHSDDPHYYKLHQHYGSYLSGIVAVSHRILRKAETGNVPAAVIPCGINMNKFFPGNKQKKICWVGRVEEEQKRVGDVVPICLQLLSSHPGWTVEVYGHGDRLPWLQEEQKRLGLFNLKLHGWQDANTIATALQEASVLLQTSNYEGMSVAVMEALASGCSVVSSRVSGVEDLESLEGAQGIVRLYEVGDVTQAIDHLECMLSSQTPDISVKARALAEQYFSIGSCVEAYNTFTRKLRPVTNAMPFRFSALQGIGSDLLATMRLIKYNITK